MYVNDLRKAAFGRVGIGEVFEKDNSKYIKLSNNEKDNAFNVEFNRLASIESATDVFILNGAALLIE